MGAIGLFFGWRQIIIISLIGFLLGALIGIALMILRKKNSGDYIPFGPFLVMGAYITMIVPFEILVVIMMEIFTLSTWNN